VEVTRQFQMPRNELKYFDMISVNDYPSPAKWKRWVKYAAGKVIFYLRAKKYHALSAGAEVVNFQQTLNAFGATTLFYWLNKPTSAARVVTVHELDDYQLSHPAVNKTYNKADAIIVEQGPMKDKLVKLGVDPNKIEVVLHGTDLPPLDDNARREGVVSYSGHHPFSNKGLQAILDAMVLLKTRMGAAAPKLKLHGYIGEADVEELKMLVKKMKLEDDVVWLNQITMPEALREYQKSAVCVLPFMGSFAGLSAATAAAAGLPIVGTKNAGIIDHIGENGIWIEKDDSAAIAERLEKLLCSADLRRDLSQRLRKRAEECLGWDTVAANTLEVYEKALQRKSR
jgi:glycosyltransferase involved in cell wall biosynthesis